MKLAYEPFDVSGVRTYALASRASKARHEAFATPWDPATGFSGWLDSLPRFLAAADFRAVVDAIRRARDADRAIVWGLGAHVIKTGLAPILIDLMERGFISAIAMNGAGVIHDYEIAIGGATSEDVDSALGAGRFGMAEETGVELNRAIADGVGRGLGLGQSIVAALARRTPAPPFAHVSLLAAAARLDIPVTVHVAIGTDITHMHPMASGAATGEGSLRDFRYFTSFVAKLGGGVYLNCGSAVVLPEVFLKAVSLVRNQGVSLDGLTTVNLDFLRSYRAETNVVRRPVADVGKGYSLTGHHELLVPLLAAALRTESTPEARRSRSIRT